MQVERQSAYGKHSHNACENHADRMVDGEGRDNPYNHTQGLKYGINPSFPVT